MMSPSLSLLPPHSSPLERALEAAMARIGDIPTPIAPVWDVDACPEDVLPYLAWTVSVDDWDETWPVRIKRAVIRAAIAVHRHKGTIGAVYKALEAMDLDLIRVIEWWETDPPGEPYTFGVEVGTLSRGISPREWDGIHAAVVRATNLRSHLGALKIYLQTQGAAPSVACGLLVGADVTVYPWTPTDVVVSGPPTFVAVGLHTWSLITIRPGSS